MTKAEKIKTLPIDELIELLLAFESGNMKYCYQNPNICDNDCEVCLLEWLNSEFEEGVSFYY